MTATVPRGAPDRVADDGGGADVVGCHEFQPVTQPGIALFQRAKYDPSSRASLYSSVKKTARLPRRAASSRS